uniref:Jumonji domain-containing protein 4 n=1 Tax=Ceratitis capitata TaxID=7213 RepID=W8BXH8_CERCA
MVWLNLLNNEKRNSIARTSINRLGENTISYTNFYWKYLYQNWPVIITNVSNEWECSKSWLTREDYGKDVGKCTKINFDFLKDKIGNRQVPVTHCDKSSKENATQMLFFNYMNNWQNSINNFESSEISRQSGTNVYLKDWHLKAELPNYEFYKVPKYFGSDWLNEYLVDKKNDDYRFVYMGPKNTWTPFHVDVFGSFSWSTNIFGTKKWILLPPGEQVKLLDRYQKLPDEISEESLNKRNVIYFVIYQQENEAIFVPSGWYHQVYNITDTISVNHNWFNAVNIKYIWYNIAGNLRKVIKEINDFREESNFEEQCQAILRADFGLNISDFLDLVCFIAEKRISMNSSMNHDFYTKSNSEIRFLNKTSILNGFHILYDLKTINNLLKVIIQDKIIYKSTDWYEQCLETINLTNKFCEEEMNKE